MEIISASGMDSVPAEQEVQEMPAGASTPQELGNVEDSCLKKKAFFVNFFTKCFFQQTRTRKQDKNEANGGRQQMSFAQRALHGNIEENIFKNVMRPVSIIKGYKVQIHHTYQFVRHHSYFTDGFMYYFDPYSVFLKLEIDLKTPVKLSGIAAFLVTIIEPSRCIQNELKVHYDITKVDLEKIAFGKQVAFGWKEKEKKLLAYKLAVIQLRYMRKKCGSLYLSSKVRILINRSSHIKTPTCINIDLSNSKFDLFGINDL